jgi:hypothetical protein
MYHVHVNTAGLHASAARGLIGRPEYDTSNPGLCQSTPGSSHDQQPPAPPRHLPRGAVSTGVEGGRGRR